MPGYILHLTAAKMYLNLLAKKQMRFWDAGCQNEFYIGNLLPDTVREKSESHFRDPKYRERMMEWPQPEKFLRKYRERMNEAVYQGYHFHLYIDKCFFKDYIPQAVVFYDEHGRVTELRREVREILIQKSGERISLPQYLSEEYYYGDYTKMNTWLWERFELPEHLRAGSDPEIEEADYQEIEGILRQLEEYRKVPANAVEELKVFQLDRLLAFLEKAAENYASAFLRDNRAERKEENRNL